MLRIDSNIRVAVSANQSDALVQLCEDNGVPCYYCTAEGDLKMWELHVDGAEIAAVGDLLRVLAEEFA